MHANKQSPSKPLTVHGGENKLAGLVSTLTLKDKCHFLPLQEIYSVRQ